MIVAIDGPAGSGKSTAARASAQALGFRHLDTGAMYRAVALASLRDPAGRPAALAGALEFPSDGRVLLHGRDVSAQLRSAEVSEAASRVAADPAVRAALVVRQRELTGQGDWVAEGRDIGTVVAPDAAVKIFLDADPRVRAQRRAREAGADPAEVLAAQRERDARDAGRAHSPLAAAPDAVVLDTTDLGPEQVVERIVALVRAAQDAGGR